MPYYLQALDVEPNSADTLNNLAISVALSGQSGRARDLLRAALDLDPANGVIVRNASLIGRTPAPSAPPSKGTSPLRLVRTGVAEFSLYVGPNRSERLHIVGDHL
jgi:hypothetical protein